MRIPENILVLIEKYQVDTATQEEILLLNEWYHSFNDSEIELTAKKDETEQQLADRIKNRLLETIRHDYEPVVITRPRRKWQVPAAAAVILILLSAGTYFIFISKSSKQEIVKTEPIKPQLKNDIAPGGNKAVLTLADGSTIILDSAANGTLTQQGNTKIIKLSNGQLAYNQLNEKPGEPLYNTISTPRGGKYQIVLVDGTKVWLNAASSLRFPASFVGKERNVELTGEGYFEVTKNTEMPFTVTVNDLQVNVLGTHFNINAYNDETSVKTTLLVGSVRVVNKESTVSLKPGQQAQQKDKALMVINNVDVEKVISWKTGFFEFDNTDLATIMRQISRWYNVDVRYEGKQSSETFGGRISRDLYLSNILSMLETNGVKFRLEGKNLIVQQ